MANDTPNINLTHAQLEKESAAPEPFVFALPGGKRVTFPDFYNQGIAEYEKFLKVFKASEDDLEAMKEWLSKKDYEAYVAANMPVRMHARLVEMVFNYYQKTVGTPGE